MAELEVENTYYEEKTETETVTLCDACGSPCEERGGHVTMTEGESTFRAPNYHSRVEQEFEKRLTDEFGSTENEPRPPHERLGHDVVNITVDQPVIKFTGKIGSKYAYNEATRHLSQTLDQIPPSKFETDTGPKHDFCKTCKDALDQTSETLDTAIHEPDDTDSDTDVGYPWYLKAPFLVGLFLFTGVAGQLSVVFGSIVFIVWVMLIVTRASTTVLTDD